MSESLSEKEQKATREFKANETVVGLNEPEIVEKEAEAVGKVVVQAIEEKFSGPIPHPDIIEKYERILPGSADRIMSMAENQATHRQNMEKKMIESEARDSFLGIIFAFLLGFGSLGACVVVVFLVPKSAGAIASAFLGMTGIGSITTGFIRSAKHIKPKEEKNKNT